MPRRYPCLFPSLLLLAACASTPTPAPQPSSITPSATGDTGLKGRVLDGAGSPLPGVTVSVTSPELLSGRLTTVSDRDGRYRFPRLPAGVYGVSAELFGFRRFEQEGLKVAFNSTTRFDPVLTVEGVEIGIEVRAHEDIVKPEKTQVSFSLADYAPPSGTGGGSLIDKAVNRGRSAATTTTSAALAGAPSPRLPDELLVIEAPAWDLPGLRRADGTPPAPATLRPRGPNGELRDPLPLKRAEVAVSIANHLATTRVRHEFFNDAENAVEVVYRFPLPPSAAVHQFVMEIGTRRVLGIVRPREEARRIYEDARARGQTVSLLRQSPTSAQAFEQTVANVAPQTGVSVEITYFDQLSIEDGSYTYTFPFRSSLPSEPAEGGLAAAPAPPTPVPGGGQSTTSASPRLAPGELGHRISFRATIAAGVPIGEVRAPHHAVLVERPTPHRAEVRLARFDTIANRDLVLRYRLAGTEARASVMAHRGKDGEGFFNALVMPPAQLTRSESSAREVTFIVDSSGSMMGEGLQTARDIVKEALQSLQGWETFTILRFNDDVVSAFRTPQPATSASVTAAHQFLDRLAATGGTDMLEGIRAFDSVPHDPGRTRVACLLTDGKVDNEAELIAAVAAGDPATRWYVLSIAASPNRSLADGITRGRGAAIVALPEGRGAATVAARRLELLMGTPVMTDVRADFGGLPVFAIEPADLGHLVEGRPIELSGRYTGPARGTITIRGRRGGQEVAIPVAVDLPESEPRFGEIRLGWARAQLGRLLREIASDPREPLVEEATRLAVDFGLLSPYTSMVAVDASRVASNGRPIRVVQPVPHEETQGLTTNTRGRPLLVPAWGVVVVQRDDGRVLVARVDDPGPAWTEGIRPGDLLDGVAGVRLQGLGHLETTLLQLTEPDVSLDVSPEDGAARRVVLPNQAPTPDQGQ